MQSVKAPHDRKVGFWHRARRMTVSAPKATLAMQQ
jgi:hypothetical protein